MAWPNCAAPGDTIWVKAKGFPRHSGYIFYNLGTPYANGGCAIWGDSSYYRDTEFRIPISVFDVVPDDPDLIPPYDGYVCANQIWCIQPDFLECGGAATGWCLRVPFHVVESHAAIGNPWFHELNLVRMFVDGTPIGPQDRGIDLFFDPSRFCNTSECSKIRLIQVLRPLVRQGNAISYMPLAQQHRGNLQAAHWQDMDANTVNEHVVDYVPLDVDPYFNGETDVIDLFRIESGNAAVGSMGPLVESLAKLSDSPSGGAARLWPTNVSSMIREFEVNAFCSDGPNEGEWIGRATWRWEQEPGQLGTIDNVEFLPLAKPTEGFMDALTAFCTAKGFAFPGIRLPDKGGIPCEY